MDRWEDQLNFLSQLVIFLHKEQTNEQLFFSLIFLTIQFGFSHHYMHCSFLISSTNISICWLPDNTVLYMFPHVGILTDTVKCHVGTMFWALCYKQCTWNSLDLVIHSVSHWDHRFLYFSSHTQETLQMEKAQQMGGHVADIYLKNTQKNITEDVQSHCFNASVLCNIIHVATSHGIKYVPLESAS